ncbi:hypothetical protein HK096_010527, partial [Nowakowskiella sp. JEL0078]
MSPIDLLRFSYAETASSYTSQLIYARSNSTALSAPVKNEDIIKISGIAASGLSIFMSSVVFIIYTRLRINHPDLANRVSLRMAVAIQLADLLYNVGTLFGLLPTSFTNTSPLALNLIIVFTNTKKLEKWYYVVSIIFAGGISAVPLSFNRLGRGRYECWFALKPEEDLINQFLWEWMSFYIWAGISIGFCSISTLLFWWSLSAQAKIIEEQTIAQDQINSGVNIVSNHSNNGSNQGNIVTNQTKDLNVAINLSKMVRRAVTRISLYCLVPFFSQICKNAVSAIEFTTARPAPWQLVLVAIVTSGLQ